MQYEVMLCYTILYYTISYEGGDLREAAASSVAGPRRSARRSGGTTCLIYTQFAIQDSCLFGPNPWKILAPPSNYLSKNDFWATQPLEQILVAEFLLCELGVTLLV